MVNNPFGEPLEKALRGSNHIAAHRYPIANANGCQIPIAFARGHYPRVANLGDDPMDGSPWPLLNRKVDSSSSFGLPY